MTRRTRQPRRESASLDHSTRLPEAIPSDHDLADAAQQLQTGAPDAVLTLQQTIGNRAVQRLLADVQRDDDDDNKKVPSKTGFLGFNAGATKEATALKGRLKDDVITALNDPAAEATLQTDQGIAVWVARNLGLHPLWNFWTFMLVYNALLETMPTARDVMGQVYKMFHGAEKGDYRLERLVLSGHSNGIALWGDDTASHKAGGIILEKDLLRLVQTFPNAAAQVEDVMFSACYSINSVYLVVKLFPNLKTAWGYAGLSPDADSGSAEHIKKWEKETRGDKNLQASDGVGKAALWTRDEAGKGGTGFIRNDPADVPLDKHWKDYSELWPDYSEQFDGTARIHLGQMTLFYGVIQSLLNHPALPTAERPGLEAEMNIVLRMRYYDKVCERFAAEYQAQITDAYARLGIRAPNFARMSRARLKRERERVETALILTPDAVAKRFLDYYLGGLWSLEDKSVVPDNWI